MRPYPQRDGESLMRTCRICGEERWIAEFRVLSSGVRASYCQDCENAFRAAARKQPGLKIESFRRIAVLDSGQRLQ